MQSSYGGVSEIQQFMVESCGAGAPSLFSSAAADIHSAVAGGGNPLKYQATPPQPGASLPPHFAHFHSIPITQQLFQQPAAAAAHQFQLFHPHHHQLNYQPLEPRRLQIPHHHLGLDQDSGPENSASSARVNIQTAGGGGGGPPSFLAEAMNFKLAVNESSGGGSREGINDEDGILRGGDDDGSESRLHHWQRDDESSIKELSWRPLDLDIDYINRNNKRCKNKEPESSINGAGTGKVSKKNKEEVGTGSSNYKIFSELEAIYKPGGSGVGVGGVNQTGSGSALTGDETPLLHAAAMAPPGLAAAADCVGGMSETSAGEEAGRPGKKFSNNNSSSSGRRRRKGRRWQRKLSSMATFFENLVKQLMDHQEGLHRKFLEAMESREQERTSREEAWRKQEAAKSCREASARATERKFASSREAAIIAFLEKITGESLNLPPKPQFSDENNNNSNDNNFQIEPYNEAAFGDHESNKVQFNTSRWPKTEVQALIRVRSGLESQFQEPGLKGPLWEEVSATMAAMGYLRSAKRCKEKWENINKYFRKTKESGKKRPQHSKTCPYFQQLDQLYSTTTKSSSHNKDNIPKEQRPIEEERDSEKKHDDDASEDKLNDNSELLDAIVVPPAVSDYPSLNFGFDFNGKVADENTEDGGAAPNTDRINGDENEEDEEQVGEEVEEEEEEAEGDQEGEEAEGEEGEGENQEHRTRHQLDQEVDELHDTSLFFQRLQS